MPSQANVVRHRPIPTTLRMALDPSAALRLQRDVEHLHCLGPRAVAEALAEIAARYGCTDGILTVLAEYRRLNFEMMRAAGGDRFPLRPLRVVPW